MKKRAYTQPELELKAMLSMETVANGLRSGDDNDIDISDTGWGET